jgi:POT family proton-dependent oligopeptide transporter
LSLVTKLSPAQIVGFLMGIWFLSSSIAHQAGKHIAKLTTVSEAIIMEGDSFKSRIKDETLSSVLASDEFKEILRKKPTEKALVTDETLDMLNAGLETPKFVKTELKIKEVFERSDNAKTQEERAKIIEESTKFYLVYREDLERLTPGVVGHEEASKIIDKSISGTVISSIRNDSLKLGMSVFRTLGFFAIGCGALLFLLGPIVSRWMHGIK